MDVFSSDGSFVLFSHSSIDATRCETVSAVDVPRDDPEDHPQSEANFSIGTNSKPCPSHLETIRLTSLPELKASSRSDLEKMTRSLPGPDEASLGTILVSDSLVPEDIQPAEVQQTEKVADISPEVAEETSNVQTLAAALPPGYVSHIESHLRELRNENERVKVALNGNNEVMKRQLKVVQSWQDEVTSSRKMLAELKDTSNAVIEDLKRENLVLSEKVRDWERRADMKLMEQTSLEVASLRSELDESVKYEQLNVQNELKVQDVTEKLILSKGQLLSMEREVASLRQQLTAAQQQIEIIPVIRSQLELYSSDFKTEEEARLKAAAEVDGLRQKVVTLKDEKARLEERLDLGPPVFDLKAASLAATMDRSERRKETARSVDGDGGGDEQASIGSKGHRHHHHVRKSHLKLGLKARNHRIPEPSVGLHLQGFKQFKST